jgi:hypothetical protein
MINKRLEALIEKVAAKKGLLKKTLKEEGEAAAQPIATSDAPAKEHTPEAEKEDIHTSQTAEELKAKITEDVESEVAEAEENIADKGEFDYEGDMAIDQIRTIVDAAVELHNMLDGNPDANLPEWVQSKLTLTKEYIDTVRDYLKSNVAGEVVDQINDAGEEIELSRDEAQQLMEALNLDTRKYTFEYLAEQIGLKKKTKKGSAAAKPIATAAKKPVGHTPVLTNKQVHDKIQAAPELKAKVINEAAKGRKSLKVKLQPKKNVVIDNKGHLNQASASITPASAVVTKAGK